MSKYIRSTLVTLVAVSIGLTFTSDDSHAQYPFPVQDIRLPASDPGAFTPISSSYLADLLRSAREQFQRASEAESKEQAEYANKEALKLIVAALEFERLDQTAVEIEQTEETRWRGGSTALRETISSLPKSSRKFLESELDTTAEVELGFAKNDPDTFALIQFVKRYGFTRAGMLGARYLASQALESGDFGTARFALRRLLDAAKLAEDQSNIPSIGTQLAYALSQLDSRSELNGLKEELSPYASKSVLLGNETRALGEVVKEFSSNSKDTLFFESNPLFQSPPTNSLSNAYVPESGGTLSSVEWSEDLESPAAPKYRATTNHAPSDFMNYPQPELPPVIPSVYQSLVIANSGEHLTAINLLSGSIEWKVHPFESRKESYHLVEQDPNLILTCTAWGGLAFAALENPQNYNFDDPRPLNGYDLNPVYPMVRRALVAVDTSTGNIRWKLGGKYALDKEDQDKSRLVQQAEVSNFYHSLVVEDVLYAIAATRENQADLFLFAIDPHTGTPIWRLALCQGQSVNTMFGGASREPLPGIPVYGEGKLYVVSNLGGVVAVDLKAREIDWITRYEAIPRPYHRRSDTRYRKVTFGNGPAILTRDKLDRPTLLIAPTDARHISALDPATGAIRWEREIEARQLFSPPQHDSKPTAMIGAHDNLVYVGNSAKIGAYDLVDGSMKSRVVVRAAKNQEQDAVMTGRPALTRSTILWPTRGGVVECPLPQPEDRLISGKLYPTAGNAGNLRVTAGVLVNCMGLYYYLDWDKNYRVEVRFNRESMLQAAKAAYERDRDNPATMLSYALLASSLQNRSTVDDGEIERILKRAFELAQQDKRYANVRESAQRELFNRAFERLSVLALGNDHIEFLAAVQEAEKFISNDNQREDLFRMRESYVIRQQDVPAQIELYTTYLQEHSFEVNCNYGKLPITSYALERRARARLASLDFTGAVNDLQQIIQLHSHDDEFRRLYRDCVELLISTLKNHGREHYAAWESAASKFYEELRAEEGEASTKSVSEWFALALRYPASDAAIDSLRVIIRRAENDPKSEWLGRKVHPYLKNFPITQREIMAWIDLVEAYFNRRQNVAAFLTLNTIAKLDHSLKIQWKGEDITLGEFLDTPEAKKILQAGSPNVEPALLPLQNSPAWTIDLSPKTKSNEETSQNLLLYMPTVSPLGTGEHIYISRFIPRGSRDTIAVNAKAGEIAWESGSTRVNAMEYHAGIGNRIVFFSTRQVTAIEPEKGRSEWEIPTGGSRRNALYPLVAAGLALFVVEEQGRPEGGKYSLVAVNAEEGLEAWRTPLIMKTVTEFALTADGVYVVGAQNTEDNRPSNISRLDRFDLSSGTLLGTTEIDGRAYRRQMACADSGHGVIYTSGGSQGGHRLNLIDLRTTSVVWSVALQKRQTPRQLYISDDRIVATYFDSSSVALSITDGSEVWNQPSTQSNLTLLCSQLYGDVLMLVTRRIVNREYIIQTTSINIKDGSTRGAKTFEIMGTLDPSEIKRGSIRAQSQVFRDGACILLADTFPSLDPATSITREMLGNVRVLICDAANPSKSKEIIANNKPVPSLGMPMLRYFDNGIFMTLNENLYCYRTQGK